MIPNSHITIYNKYTDNTRKEKYQRTVIRDVVWQAARAVYVSGAGMVRANTAFVMIPFARGADYLAPKAWQAAKSGKWTLQEGDVIVRGIVTNEITEAVVLPTPVAAFTMTSLRALHEDVVVINNIYAMDEGSFNMQHWEVDCK